MHKQRVSFIVTPKTAPSLHSKPVSITQCDNCGDEDRDKRYFLKLSQNCFTYLEYPVEEFPEIWGRKLLRMKSLHLNQQRKQF